MTWHLIFQEVSVSLILSQRAFVILSKAKLAIFEAEKAVNASRKAAADEIENEAIKAKADAKAAKEIQVS